MKMTGYLMVASTILFGLLLACSYISDKLNFTQPEVTSIYPSNLMTNVSSDVIIEVRFSREMDTIKTNNAFTLSSSSGAVNGYFRWFDDDRTLSFEPKTILDDSEAYRITISSEAEDRYGNDLKQDFSSVFYIGVDLGNPEVVSYRPVNDAIGVAPDSSVVINFSEAIDLNTLYEGITISPALQRSYSWNQDRTVVTLDPLCNLCYGTTYTVRISEKLTDISGNPLSEQVSFSFTVGDDFVKPTVISVRQNPLGAAPPGYSLHDPWLEGGVNYAIEKQNAIEITFSEEILADTLYDAITISPHCDFYIDSNPARDQAVIIFNRPMDSESNYTLSISSIVADLQNNALDRKYSYQFFTNGIYSLRPYVEYITDPSFDSDGWSYPPSDTDPEQDYWTFGEVETLILSDPPSYPDVYVVFASQVPMIPSSISISIEKVAGSTGTGNGHLINPDWPALAPGRFYVYKIDLDDVTAGNMYKITIKGGEDGATDAKGNCMAEDFVQFIRF
jgi:hypothetical protein